MAKARLNMIVTLAPRTSARFAGIALPECCQGPALQHLIIPRVASWSMFPTLCKGDCLELGSVEFLQMGDLVVFRSPFGLICHRLVAQHGNRLHTKGDAESSHPELVMRHDVLGIVVAVVRGSTRVLAADLAALPPPPPWARSLDRLSLSLWEQSRQIARYARIEPMGKSPLQSLHHSLMPYAPPESGPSQPDRDNSPAILGIRLGPIYLGIFYPDAERLDIRPVFAGTAVESILAHTLRLARF